jgi:hypothetical protein
MHLDANERAEMGKQFEKQFNADQIREQMERFWYIFPNKEVKIGDSWQRNNELKGDMPGTYKSTYTVKEIEGDMVTLDEVTHVESNVEKMKLNGDITGTIVVDSKIGLVVVADQDMKIKAEAEGMSFEVRGKTKVKGKAR